MSKAAMNIRYKSGYKYVLVDPCTIRTGILVGRIIHTPFILMDHGGLLMVRPGYAWDGASGPAFDTDSFMRGSLVHDALYQLMRDGLLEQKYRQHADWLLVEICKQDGMCWIRRQWVYWAVRMFGRINLRQNEIFTAPRPA